MGRGESYVPGGGGGGEGDYISIATLSPNWLTIEDVPLDELMHLVFTLISYDVTVGYSDLGCGVHVTSVER